MSADILGRGLPFPFAPRARGGMAYLGGDEKIRQSIWLILTTSPGERQMLPDFGCGIHDLVFEANTATFRGIILGRVRDALARWEPRIDVLEVQVETPGDARNYLLIRIDYRVRANNSLYNLVYPFFINEGAG